MNILLGQIPDVERVGMEAVQDNVGTRASPLRAIPISSLVANKIHICCGGGLFLEIGSSIFTCTIFFVATTIARFTTTRGSICPICSKVLTRNGQSRLAVRITSELRRRVQSNSVAPNSHIASSFTQVHAGACSSPVPSFVSGGF